jgi:hypothetical protein
MKWDKELLLGANSITEAMHISAFDLYEEVEDKSKVVQVCAWYFFLCGRQNNFSIKFPAVKGDTL